MNATRISIKDIKSNPNNPRIIKDDKFKKLVQSIIDFPRMLEIRPIEVNIDVNNIEDRLKALEDQVSNIRVAQGMRRRDG